MDFSGEVIWWKGPAPFVFVAIPAGPSLEIHEQRKELTYGWGVIPVVARIGGTEFETALFPKGANYLLPIRKSIQLKESISVGDSVEVSMRLVRGRP